MAPNLPQFVADWNARYETPRLVIDSAQGLFEGFERRYGASLPEKRGGLTPYWEDGALSSAGEEILARAAARRLVQAEALWGAADAFPRDRFEEAWRQVLLWHEHTWGAAASISEPDRPDVVAQWEYKRAFAGEADRLSRELLDEASGRKAVPTILGVGVANTLSRPRGGLVVLPAGRSRAGERVTDSQAAAMERGLKAIVSSRLGIGRLHSAIEWLGRRV